MKTALDCYGRGKQKECNADEYIVGSVYSRDRFICPECGESVHLRRSKYSNYFAHYKRQNTSAECDRRVDGVPTDSIYERIGLPIYLRNGAVKGTFELSLGFKALPRSLMEDAEKSKLQVSIDGESSYLVNRERFSEESTVLIPMDMSKCKTYYDRVFRKLVSKRIINKKLSIDFSKVLYVYYMIIQSEQMGEVMSTSILKCCKLDTDQDAESMLVKAGIKR